MNEEPNDSPKVAPSVQSLRELRKRLMHLHKELLGYERASYEQLFGPVTSGQLLDLVINHEQFAWLRSISELIVRIDEKLDDADDLTDAEIDSLFSETRALLIPEETGGVFQQNYYWALQHTPAALIEHGELRKLIG